MSKAARVPRKFRRAVLGGTFDHFHRGHESLLQTAFSRAGAVGIGITSEEYLRSHPKPYADHLQPFSTRRRVVESWLLRNFPGREWWTVAVSSQLGGALDPRVDLLVATSQTLAGARAVNRARRRRGIRPVSVLIAPLALASDRRPISSRRIRAGLIDARGLRKKPVSIAVVGAALPDRASILRGLRSIFCRVPIRVMFRRLASSRQASPAPTATLRAIAAARGGLATSELALGIVVADSAGSSNANRRAILALALADESGVAVVGLRRPLYDHRWASTLKGLGARLRPTERPKDSSLAFRYRR